MGYNSIPCSVEYSTELNNHCWSPDWYTVLWQVSRRRSTTVVIETNSWRRRRRRRWCPTISCQVNSWSQWSQCTTQQCGVSGTRRRIRSIISYPSCGGSGCPSLQETQICFGSTPVNCSYSAWSSWSECSQCGESQTRQRYIVILGQCGGTPCRGGPALNQTRICKTRCLHQGNLKNVDLCTCPPNLFESCCLYNGFNDPCPYGKEGEPPNCYDPPAQFSSDNFGFPEITYIDLPSNDVGEDVNAASVTLLCKAAILNGIEKWRNVSYLIEWIAEGRTLKNETRCEVQPGQTNENSCPDQELSSQLPGEKYTIGQSISCKVSAKFTTSPKNVWSSPKQVPRPFFAGLKVDSTALNINLENCETQLYPIEITPTIPVRKTQWLGNGLPRLSFYTPREAIILEGCEVELKQGVEPVRIVVKAACLQPNEVSVGLKPIIPHISHPNSPFWNQWIGLPTIWVSIRDKTKIEQCISWGDPHYDTLHPLSFGPTFHFMGRGDFILYKNSERYFEVQTRQWTCYRSVACNCGAVLRDHNDVIEFNCCNDHMVRDSTTPLRVKIRSKKCLSPGISITKLQPGARNARYQVMFPSGAKVEILRGSWGMDVTVYTPRAKDPGKESGLCIFPPSGLDHNTYGERLRVLPGESYFDVLPPQVSAYDVEYSEACYCDSYTTAGTYRDTHCYNAFELAFPTLIGDRRRPSPLFLCDRQKRDIQFSDEPRDDDFHLFQRTLPLRKRHKRESGRISKENATYYCEAKISKTKIGKLCAKLGINVQALVNVCSFDVEYTGDFSYALGGVDALTDQCENLAALNLSRAANSSGDGAVESSVSSLVEEIAESLCPNDCSSNGRCVNGSCVCNKNFTADDCSAYIYEIPTIFSLQGNGLCDRRTRPCRKVTVLGTGFIPSGNMTCHVEEFKVVNSTWSPNNTELKFPGVMTDLVLADCNLPESPVSQGYFHEINPGTPAAGLKISVSNDGKHRSQGTLTMISYDSACMSCNISSGCFLKENSCFINGYCFFPNESNPIDWCYQCLPGVNTSVWTKREVNLPPKFSPATPYYALYQENLELPIKVVDPEGMPIKVTLMDGSPSEAIIRDNVLVWNASNSPNTRFKLKATDACQAVSTTNITISLVVCPCQNNGKCIPHPGRPRGSGLYQCNCAPGFTGDTCGTNIDECQSYPCVRGRCFDELNNYSCICDPGYVGRNCDTDYDDCSSSPCVHGNCTDYTGSYRCTCDPGYAGKNCTIDANECASSPCRHGTCVDQVNSYICQCDAGYTGYDCTVEIDECQSSPCVHGACKDQVNGFICSCDGGFSGIRCEEDIDDCQSSPCVNGICTDLVNNYTCRCVAGFTGRDCDIVVTTCSADSCFPNVTCSKNGQTIACGPCPLGFTGDGKICKDIDDCVNHTCANGASCTDGINSYSCNCSAGFSGAHCETDIDDCANHRCTNGASCVDGINSYSCNCTAGLSGVYCETDLDDCVNHNCSNGAPCIDGINSYSCNCSAGFTGLNCETDIDDCMSHTCANGASCVDGINTYSCNCAAGFTGAYCDTNLDDCVNHNCSNGASCIDGINSYSCNCTVGFTGSNRETDIDDCVNHTCTNGASCIDGINGYSCNCSVGFSGEHCENNLDDCVNHNCSNGTSCVGGINSYSCNCSAGFTGSNCETDIDDCVNHTCTNGASCIDGINGYSCNCSVGFSGENCENNLDDCVNHNCSNGASCIDGINSYSCNCTVGFTGSNCETDINDCVSHTCANGASCVDGINTYSCKCTAGFAGWNCETDIDDCVSHTCANGASCVNGINTYSCSCAAGFTGAYCDTNIDDCVNHTCTNDASCIDGINGYSCNCSVGYSGEHCENNLDDCASHNCSNGASCIDGINSYSCNCSVGFTGSNCETDIDDCVSHTCANGASCVDGINTYSCKCAAGFTGWSCQTGIDDCLSHVCTNGGSCVDGIGSYMCKCTVGFTGKYCETDLASLSGTISPKTDPSTEITAVTTRNVAEYSYKIKLMENWNDDLKNKSSEAFKLLKTVLEEEIMNKLRKMTNIIEVHVVSFSKGSIVAEFKLTFNENGEPKEAFEMLKEGINDGDIGTLRVDPSSLVLIPSATEEPIKELTHEIIIGVSLSGLFVVVLCTIFFVRLCKNKIAAHTRIQSELQTS